MHYLLKDAGIRDPDVKGPGIIRETSGPFRAHPSTILEEFFA